MYLFNFNFSKEIFMVNQLNKEAFANAIRIFNNNESVDNYNLEKLVEINQPICFYRLRTLITIQKEETLMTLVAWLTLYINLLDIM
jgi:hypothetical protein